MARNWAANRHTGVSRGVEPPAVFGVASRNRFKGNLDGSGRQGLVAARDFLPDLSALFSGLRWRRGRRHQWRHRAAALSEVARHRCGLAVADLSVADGGFRLRHLRLHRYRSAVRHHGGFRRAGGGRARQRPQDHPRSGAEPHLRPASLVHRVAQRARKSEARLVHLARSAAGRRAAQQLAVGIRRQRLAVRRGHRAVLLSRLPRRAAGPELAQSGGARGDLRRHALLAAQGRRRLSRRRDLASDQGFPVSRQPAQSAFRRGAAAAREDPDAVFDRSARGARGDRGNAARDRRIRRPRPDRRDLSAAATPRRLLRQQPDRRADAVQFRAAVDAVERALDRAHHRRLRTRACRRARGRTGCSAITIARGSRAGSGASRRGSPRCCC